MRGLWTLALVTVTTGGGVVPAYAYDVIVPETTYSTLPVSMTVASTALLDSDSVIVTYTEHPGGPQLGTTKFQVVNINTGAIELPPTPLPTGLRIPSVAVLGPDSAVIVTRDDNDGAKGKYFVVNPLTGAIIRGPIVFSSAGTGYEYRMAVADPSTVLIAHRSYDGLKGKFTVVDPQTGTLKVPETTFEPAGINTLDVVAMNSDRVVIAYERSSEHGYQSFFTVLDPHTGSTVLPPVEFEPSYGIPRVLKLDATDVLIVYRDTGSESRFVRVNTVTGAMDAPATYGGALTWDFSVSPAILGSDSLFIPYWRTDAQQGFFVVHDIGGATLVPETSFNPGATYYVSTAASGCRVLLSYQDVGDGQKGKFQVLDFPDVCTPAPCPPEVTDRVDIFVSHIYRIPFTPFRFQWVLMRNKTPDPISGPLSFVMDNLQHAVFIGSPLRTSCLSATGDPFAVIHTGSDEVLSPDEFALALLLFFKTQIGPITYTARVLSGVPTQ